MSLRSVPRLGNNPAPRFSVKKVPGSAIILSLPLAAVLAACGSSTPMQTSSPTGPPTTGTPDQRADALLAQMTQAQKLQMVAGGVANDPSLNYAFPRGAGGLDSGHSATQHSGSVFRRWQRGRGQWRRTRHSLAVFNCQRCRLGYDGGRSIRHGDWDRAERLRHQRQPGWQHESDGARAARRPDIRDQGRGSHSGREDCRRASGGHTGAACDRRYQALRL